MARSHFIEFRKNAIFNSENGPTPTCQLCIGNQTPAQVRCYVIYVKGRYVEVADIEVPEGKLRGVPCAWFMFIDMMG